MTTQDPFKAILNHRRRVRFRKRLSARIGADQKLEVVVVKSGTPIYVAAFSATDIATQPVKQ